jgi:oligopeptide transport system substrate-binding protein
VVVAGVGKSRLVEEATRQAQTEGTVVLRGRCYEFGGSLPYQPIAEALRSVPQAELPIAHLDPVWLAELACLLPEVRQRRPDLPDPAASNGEAARQRLFESVARLLSPPQGQPLIFFLDDLHWADQATLDLLHYLVRRLKEAPTWLLGVYRSEEVALGHPLVQLRLGLERDHCVEALALGPLSEAAVQQIARALAGEQDSAALGAFLHQKSEGNPFVLSEMVEALREGGALREGDGGWVFEQTRLPEIANALPSGVRAVILQRVGRLSETAQRLLALAAVIGRQFDLPLLQAAAGSGDVVDESMEEWLPRRLVKPETSSTVHIRHSFDFSHDRIREAVYQAVRPEQRRTLHRQVAQALEELADRIEANLGLLAHHWEQAGETDKAADYLLRAGDQARLLYAHQEAVDYYRRALVYLEKSGRQEEAARVLMRLGLTHHNAFQFRQARQAYDQGIALWQQAGAARPTSSAVAAGHTLRVRWLEPTTLDPAASLDDHTAALMSHLFSGLVGLDPAMYIVPDVAHAWEITEDGRRFTFHLRDDMCWSDGQAVTAQDFEYAWKRALNPYLGLPRATFFYDIKGAKAYHQGAGRAEEVGTHAMDATTLQVELAEPTGYFLQLLTYPAFYPVPRRQVEQYGPAWAEAEHIVTNGPFRLAQWQQGQSLTLERASTYHGPCTGNLQQVVLKSISDWQARLQAYEADELDVLGITYFPVEAREQARQRHAGEYISKPTLGVNYIVMDAHRPPFDDARVRRALVMATDRERLANIVLGGYAAPATGGFVPPGIPGHSPGIGLAYDPVAARRLLAQAGYPDGRGFPAVPALSYDAAAARCRYLGEQWRENLGLEVEWQIVEWAVYLDRLRGTPPSLVIMTWLADYPDPDNFLRVSHERAWPWWRNEAYGCLLAQAKKPTVQAERMALYQQADRLLIEATVALPLVYERGHLLVKPWVRRYPMSAVRTAFWKDVVLG